MTKRSVSAVNVPSKGVLLRMQMGAEAALQRLSRAQIC